MYFNPLTHLIIKLFTRQLTYHVGDVDDPVEDDPDPVLRAAGISEKFRTGRFRVFQLFFHSRQQMKV